MGLLLQIIGVVCAIISLVLSVHAIIEKEPANLAVPFLLIGIALVSIGRKMH